MIKYIGIIKQGIVFFTLISPLVASLFCAVQYKKYRTVNFYKMFVFLSFVLYSICAYFTVILPLPSIETVASLTTGTMQLHPFAFVSDFLDKSGFVLSNPATYFPAFKSFVCLQIVFNVLLTVPFGFYQRYYFKNNFCKTAVFSFCFSLFFELTQLSGLYFIYPRPYRLFDVDDLILNTLGGIVGYFAFNIICRVLPAQKKLDTIAMPASFAKNHKRINLGKI